MDEMLVQHGMSLQLSADTAYAAREEIPLIRRQVHGDELHKPCVRLAARANVVVTEQVLVADLGGEKYEQKIGEGEDATLIAQRLTMKIYRARTGNDMTGFNRPLNYPRSGVA